MSDVSDVPIRLPAKYADLQDFIDMLQREVWKQFDVRAETAFANGLRAIGGDVFIGDNGKIVDRDGTDIPTLVSLIGDSGKAADERFSNMVQVGNRSSVQTSIPLAATTGGPGLATITIAAHAVQFDFGTVDYDAGSIVGLARNVEYFVYVNDLNFNGGAVTYLATVNPATVVATQGRYYVGAITTPISDNSAAISGVTQANPGVVTANSHGFGNGDTVLITDVVGMTELNGNQYLISAVTTNTFNINQDTTAFTAYISDGNASLVVPGTAGGGGAGGGGQPWNL